MAPNSTPVTQEVQNPQVQPAAIQALKAHLGINVRDVEASIAFYKKLFNLEPAKVRKGYAKFDVQNPPLNFTLNQVPFGGAGALNHLGIQVASTEDVLAIRQQWLDRGLPVRDEMGTDCCYAVQNKSWVADPDGNEWEVFVVLKDNLAEKSERTSTCCSPAQPEQKSACCAEAATGSACGCSTKKAEPKPAATTPSATAQKQADACCDDAANGVCTDQPSCTGPTA